LKLSVQSSVAVPIEYSVCLDSKGLTVLVCDRS
jgi:hypothetical protein